MTCKMKVREKGWLKKQIRYAEAATKVSKLNPFDILRMKEQLAIAVEALVNISAAKFGPEAECAKRSLAQIEVKK